LDRDTKEFEQFAYTEEKHRRTARKPRRGALGLGRNLSG
jgi:hypothetical protein